MILRTLILHIDPKLVDTMLPLARDEHALALQIGRTSRPRRRAARGEGGEDRGARPRRPATRWRKRRRTDVQWASRWRPGGWRQTAGDKPLVSYRPCTAWTERMYTIPPFPDP